MFAGMVFPRFTVIDAQYYYYYYYYVEYSLSPQSSSSCSQHARSAFSTHGYQAVALSHGVKTIKRKRKVGSSIVDSSLVHSPLYSALHASLHATCFAPSSNYYFGANS